MAVQKDSESDDHEAIAAVRRKIANGEIDAISIDTTVFDDNGMRLDKGLFAQLEQFGRHKTDLIISEVVYKEIRAHLSDRLEKVKGRFSRDLSDAFELIGEETENVLTLKETLSNMPAADALCETQLNAFKKRCDARIINADDYVNVAELLRLYFDKLPPFHNDNPKKKEFPDAIALASLEEWAAKEKREILVVSRDGDWKSFCDRSSRLHLVKNFAMALALFQKSDDVIKSKIEQLRFALENPQSYLSESIQDSIRANYFGEDAIIEGRSRFEYSVESVSLKEISTVVLSPIGDGLSLVDSKPEAVVIGCDLDVEATFDVEFTFRIDKGTKRMSGDIQRVKCVAPGMFQLYVIFDVPLNPEGLNGMQFEADVGQAFIDVHEFEPAWMKLSV